MQIPPIWVHRSPLRMMFRKTSLLDCPLRRYVSSTSYCWLDKHCTICIRFKAEQTSGLYFRFVDQNIRSRFYTNRILSKETTPAAVHKVINSHPCALDRKKKHFVPQINIWNTFSIQFWREWVANFPKFKTISISFLSEHNDMAWFPTCGHRFVRDS